jgi:hypothetical protein
MLARISVPKRIRSFNKKKMIFLKTGFKDPVFFFDKRLEAK